MTSDFRASQIQTNKLIASGSSGTETGAKLLIYPHEADDALSPNQGYIDQAVFNTGSIGTDIFLYVSGGIGKKNVSDSHSVSVFGGDLHISGNLTVDGSYPSGGGGGGGNEYWTSTQSGKIATTGSVYINAGNAGNTNIIEFDNSGSTGAKIRVAHLPTVSNLLSSYLSLEIAAGNAGPDADGGGLELYSGAGSDFVTDVGYNAGNVFIAARGGGLGLADGSGYYGGDGGITIINAGDGGAGGNGGTAGYLSIVAGTGGDGNDAGTGVGGYGGDISISAGYGGDGVDITGQGGGITLIGGGAGSGAVTGSNGGGVFLQGGTGGDSTGGNAGNGGDIVIIAGQPGLNNFTNLISGSGKIRILGGLHPSMFTDVSGSETTIGADFGFGYSYKHKRIFLNRWADVDFALLAGQPLPTEIPDVFFFVSGGIGQKDGSVPVIACFGGDVHISGNLTVDGSYPSGGGGGGDNYFWSPVNPEIEASGSLHISESLRALHLSASNGAEVSGSVIFAGAGGVAVGSDTVFFVSGAVGYGAIDKAVFGGAVHVSGILQVEQNTPIQSRNFNSNDYVDLISLRDGTVFNLGTDVVVLGDYSRTTGIGFLDNANIVALITGSNQGYFSGSYKFPQGLSGSITKLTDGSDYIIAGTNITLSTGSNGAITINSTGGGGGDVYWQSTANDIIFTTGSVAITGSLKNGYQVVATGLYSYAGGYQASATGNYSFAQGVQTSATTNAAHAEGNNTAANAIASHAEGEYTAANAQGSHAEGYGTTASAQNSHAEGQSTTSSGQYSHAEGTGTQATNIAAHSEGDGTTATARAAHSEGQNTTASGQYSHAEGATNTASGYASHAEGGGTTASGGVAHAEGADTVAQGDRSHAEGQYTLAYGIGSHSEGYYTTGSGNYSHSEGYLTVASGTYSHAGGIGTITSGSGQTVIGKYNKQYNDFSLFVIGDGIDDNNRGDIIRVNSGSSVGAGKVEITGSFSVSGSQSVFHQYGGLRYYPTIITTTPFTASLTDYIIAVSASNATSIELPSSDFGKTFIVKDISGSAASNNITVTAAGGEEIDGSSTYTISTNRGSAKFVYFGSGNGWGVV